MSDGGEGQGLWSACGGCSCCERLLRIISIRSNGCQRTNVNPSTPISVTHVQVAHIYIYIDTYRFNMVRTFA